jgi:hypothetical protein
MPDEARILYLLLVLVLLAPAGISIIRRWWNGRR